MYSPEISICFPTMNRLGHLKRSILSIRNELTGYCDYEIVVVDGISSDGTQSWLSAQPDVVLIVESERRGCCHAFDQSLRAAKGRWVCWLNDDVLVLPDSLRAMHSFATSRLKPEDMAAFPSSRGPDKLNDFVVNTVGRFRPLIYANFGFLRRNTLETLGYLNLSYQKFGWDPDLSLRVWSSQGSVVPCNEAKIIHYFIDDGTRNNDEEKRQLDYLTLKTMWPSLGYFAEDSVYDFSKFPDYLALLDPWRRLKIMVSETNFHVAISEIHALALKSRCWGECYDIGKMMAFRGEDKLALDIFNLIIEARNQVTQDLYCWAIYQKAVLLKQKDAAESQRLMSLIEDKIEIPGS